MSIQKYIINFLKSLLNLHSSTISSNDLLVVSILSNINMIFLSINFTNVFIG